MHLNLPLVFDSDRLAAAQRVDFTREEFGRRVLRVELESLSEQPFRVRLSADSFGSTRIAAISSSPVCNTRGRELAANSDGWVGFLIPLRGRYIAGHNGAYHPLSPGQVMALSNDREGIVSCPAGGSFLTILTPQEILIEVLEGKPLKLGERLHYDSEGLALLDTYLRFIGSRNGSVTEPARALIGRQVVELLALGLGTGNDAASETSADSLITARSAAVDAEIDRHFRETWFGIETCAARLGLSVRYVQTLCQRGGTSFVEEVKRRRLAMAHRILIDPANRNMRITDIALGCGFGDISHFNRQFRAAFGDSPSGVRNSRP